MGAMKRCMLLTACLASIIGAHAVPCRDLDISDCNTEPDCTICKLNTSWAKVAFCISEETAEKLPAGEQWIKSILLPTLFSKLQYIFFCFACENSCSDVYVR